MLVGFFFAVCLPLNAAGEWGQYSNHNRVLSIKADLSGEIFWYTGGAGLVRLDTRQNIYRVFGRPEGLPSVFLTNIELTAENELLLATADFGVLFGNASGRWIRSGNFQGIPDGRINCVVASEDGNYWVAGMSGARKMTLQDGYFEISPQSMMILDGVQVNDVLESLDYTWFASDQGLWRMDSQNNFKRYSTEEGLSVSTTGLAQGPDGDILAISSGFLFRLTGEMFEALVLPSGNAQVSLLKSFGEDKRTFVGANTVLFEYLSDGSFISRCSFPEKVTAVEYSEESNTIAVGTDGGGLYYGMLDSGELAQLEIPGPHHNVLTTVVVDSRGTVWTGSGIDGVTIGEGGLSRFDSESWTRYVQSDGGLIFNLIGTVNTTSDDNVVIGTYFGAQMGTGGFNILNDGGTAGLSDDIWQRVTADASSLSTGVIRGDIAADPSGGLWIASRMNQSLPGGLEYYNLTSGAIKKFSGSLTELDVHTVAVDNSQPPNVWVGYVSNGLGVIPGGISSGSSVHQVNSFTSSVGATGIVDIAVDDVNRVWIATSTKVILLNFQGNASSEAGFAYQEIKPPNFAGLAANSILLDGLRYAWFGTASGIYLLDIENDNWDIYDRSNSALASNQVYEIALDRQHRILWAATSAGLVSLDISSEIESGGSSHEITASPNPWHPRTDGSVLLTGIPRFSELRIITVAGQVVKLFDRSETTGGTLLWDGRNSAGKDCSSGVYILLAKKADGGKASGKVALIR